MFISSSAVVAYLFSAQGHMLGEIRGRLVGHALSRTRTTVDGKRLTFQPTYIRQILADI